MRIIRHTPRTRCDGFTVTELIVATLVSMMVCGSLAVLANAASRTFRVQPETADLLQRARAGHDLLFDELSTAGAGVPAGRDPRPLVRWIPPVLPFTRAFSGSSASDGEAQAFGDRVTLITVPDGAAQATVDGATTMAAGGDFVPIVRDAACGTVDDTCGFASGQRVLLFDASPAFDIATVATPPAAASPLQLARLGSAAASSASSLSKIYRTADDARLAVARVTTFSFDAGRRQLRRSTGDGIDMPVLDEVVELSFHYFADPYPPEGPRPPPGESNCLFEATGITRLPVLAPDDGSLIELPLASFADGPFCGASPYRFDADLYRIRRVRARLRVQVPSAALRGRDPLLFRIQGLSTSVGLQIPDMVMELDVTPRNLQVR